MHTITISFQGPTAWVFTFKDHATADEVYGKINVSVIEGHPFSIHDDFGQSASFLGGTAVGILQEDMDQTQELRIQRSIFEAVGQANAQTRARTNPVLKAATQGPSVLTPFTQGNFRQN